MKTTLAVSLAATSLALGGLCMPAAASASAGTSAGPMTIQTQSGGRDAASAKRMAAAAWQYDLRLDIAGKPQGERWRDVEVVVSNPASGTVLDESTGGGPLLYARMPAGTYEVTVKDNEGHEAVAHGVHVDPSAPKPITLDLEG